jgi:hypothetical protein
LQQNAGPVAHQLIGPHSAAVVQIFQNLESVLDNGVALLTPDMGHKTHAASVVLLGAGIQTVVLEVFDFGSRCHGALLKMTVDRENTATQQKCQPI